MALPSADRTMPSALRSHDRAISRALPLARSIAIRPKRSASKPGRFIAREYRVLPSALNTGPVSQAGLDAVRFFSGWPSRYRYRSQLVDHGSWRSATRMENTSDLPSGDQVYSSQPPNGREGTWPTGSFLPAPTSTGAGALSPLAGVVTNRRLWRPSAQVSQWRTNSWS